MAVKGDHGELNRQLMMNFSSTGGGPSKWVAATLPATILYCALASTKLVDSDRAQSLSRNGHRTQLFAGLDGVSEFFPTKEYRHLGLTDKPMQSLAVRFI
jgi:hypothetical protein